MPLLMQLVGRTLSFSMVLAGRGFPILLDGHLLSGFFYSFLKCFQVSIWLLCFPLDGATAKASELYSEDRSRMVVDIYWVFASP